MAGILVLLASMLSYPGTFGLVREARLTGIKESGGLLLEAKRPPELGQTCRRALLFPDDPQLLEQGVPLARPDTSEKKITNAGRGRYQINNGRIRFSTSDARPPGDRTFSVRAPAWSLPEPLLLAIWLLALAASAIALRVARPDGSRPDPVLFQRASLVLAAGFLAAFAWFPSPLADAFFLGLGWPAIWAGLLAALGLQRTAVCRFALAVLALLPAWAGTVYYGINAASDPSFLVGGVIPNSDAWLHFVQAAEIATQGATVQLFNGRFFYPAFYAVLLDLTGLNILAANFLMSALVLAGLAATVRPVARRVGWLGASVYGLLFWLYFRSHGCGLVMTENLGVLLGVIGFGFLLLQGERKAIWPAFAAIGFLGLGLVARPGAMFVLPALALAAGFRVWISRSGRLRLASALAAAAVGLALIAGCFVANQATMKMLSRGEGATFGNFAFTLHGLLNNTKWSTSADEFGWDTKLVMQHNIEQIKADPLAIVRGVSRAYGVAFEKGFLFRFDEEKRLAGIGMALFLIGALGFWVWKPLRPDAWWIPPAFLGILASIPFAPPWDAGERPYAATLPIQIFFAAAGVAVVRGLLRMLASWWMPAETGADARPPDGAFGLIALAAGCLLLTFPIPLVRHMLGRQTPVPSDSPALLPGSQIRIAGIGSCPQGTVPREQYLDRLSAFQADHPEAAGFYQSEPGTFVLAVDWRAWKPVLVPAIRPAQASGAPDGGEPAASGIPNSPSGAASDISSP